MIIDKIRVESHGNDQRIVGRIKFELGDSEEYEIYAQVEGVSSIPVDASFLLLASFIPAWKRNESRILIDGNICPLLKANLHLVHNILAKWHNIKKPMINIDSGELFRIPGVKSGLFFSGGVDSLASLKVLLDTYPLTHPQRPSSLVFIDYQGINNLTTEETTARFEQAKLRINTVCKEVGMRLITIQTNIRCMNQKDRFWTHFWHGSVLAALSHVMSLEFNSMNWASAKDVEHLAPWGSHPELDHFFSSRHMSIIHHGIEMTRFQKVQAICDWQFALDHMQVCNQKTSRGKNCGFFEKCLINKLHLLILGRLHDAKAFNESDITPEQMMKHI